MSEISKCKYKVCNCLNSVIIRYISQNKYNSLIQVGLIYFITSYKSQIKLLMNTIGDSVRLKFVIKALTIMTNEEHMQAICTQYFIISVLLKLYNKNGIWEP